MDVRLRDTVAHVEGCFNCPEENRCPAKDIENEREFLPRINADACGLNASAIPFSSQPVSYFLSQRQVARHVDEKSTSRHSTPIGAHNRLRTVSGDVCQIKLSPSFGLPRPKASAKHL